MQVVNCSVRLGSNLNSVVRKIGVTIPEILVLRAIHGSDSVVDFEAVRFGGNVTNTAEMDRLCALYNPNLVRSVFPGASPSLPRALADIGITLAEVADIGKPAVAGGKKAGKPAVDPGQEGADKTGTDGA